MGNYLWQVSFRSVRVVEPLEKVRIVKETVSNLTFQKKERSRLRK